VSLLFREIKQSIFDTAAALPRKRNSKFVYMHPCHSSIVSAIEMDIPELRISEFVVIVLGLPRNENELRFCISVYVALAGSSDREGDTQTKFVFVSR
jgi:hypothetical protein